MISSSYKIYNMYLMTASSKQYIGTVTANSPQEAKMIITSRNGPHQIIMDNYKKTNVEFKIEVELETTQTVFK